MINFEDIEILNVEEIAVILKIEGQSVARLFRTKKIEGRKINRQWGCTKEELKAYLAGNQSVPENTATTEGDTQ